MHPAIRPATPADVADIVRLVRELAAYEREPDAATATGADFHRALFPADGHATTFAHVAEVEGRVVGIAVWFATFSTWNGGNGIWLEDLYVEDSQRGRGLGAALLAALAEVCVERGWRRLEWTVLRWNTPSIEFYRALGALPMSEWETHRMTGNALQQLAARATRAEPTDGA